MQENLNKASLDKLWQNFAGLRIIDIITTDCMKGEHHNTILVWIQDPEDATIIKQLILDWLRFQMKIKLSDA